MLRVGAPLRVTVAVAPVPPQPVKVTVGLLVYPEPPALRVAEATDWVMFAVPVAVVPPVMGALKVTLGVVV
jgi:hypothetical protein